jgi:hypothetical protein
MQSTPTSQQTVWGWLSASSATGDMHGLYFSVYTARRIAVYSEVQMFAGSVECVISHTPTNIKFYYHWLMYGATSPCLHPHIAPVLTLCVTCILCTQSVSKWCDLTLLCWHSFIYSTLITGSYHKHKPVVLHKYCKAVITWIVKTVSH